MIYVDRSRVPVPAVLLSERANQERERIRTLLSGSKDHLDQLRITFNSSLYFEAKPALLELFHSKCAYCESALEGVAPGDVEQFRPKQGATNLTGDKEQHYYAWLAFDWDNLLIACVNCNRLRRNEKRLAGKGNRFPVSGARARVLSSVADCRTIEKALLLDPCFDRPEEHLNFDASGACVPLTERGRACIDILALDRAQLVAERRSVWQLVDLQVSLHTQRRLVPAASRTEGLAELLSGRKPYTGAARAAFAAVTRTLAPDVRTALVDAMLGAIDEPFRAAVKQAAEARPPRRAVKAAKKRAVEAPDRPVKFKGKKRRLPPFAHERVRRIEIENFKAIERLEIDLPEAPHADVDLGPALLLLGENACGKSTILEATGLALLGTDGIERLELDAANYIRRTDWGAPLDRAEPARVSVYFTDTEKPVTLTIDPRRKRFIGPRRPSTVVMGYGPRRFFADGGKKASRAGTTELLCTMFDPLAVIKNPTDWLMEAPQPDFDAAVRALRQLLLLADEAMITRPASGQRKGQQIMFEVQGDVAPLNRLSEGYKTIVATGVDVMRELLDYWPDLETARGVVLIDELETHLHPRWKMRIVRRLRRAMPEVQFIATTHDPLCLRGLYDGEAMVLRRDEDRRIEKLVEVPNVRGLSVEQLLTSEFFGMFSTEDPGLEEDVARYAALAAKPDRTPAEEETLVEQRQQMDSTLLVGARPVDQLVHEAASEYVLRRQKTAAADRPALKRAALERVVGIWNQLDT